MYACDLAGSAVFDETEDLWSWVSELDQTFPRVELSNDALRCVIADYLNRTSSDEMIERLILAQGPQEVKQARGLEPWQLRVRAALAQLGCLY